MTRSMRRILAAASAGLLAAVLAPGVRADDESATRYYLALGDSYAVAGTEPDGAINQNYPYQLHEMLLANNPKLKLVNLACGGESTWSMRFGSQWPQFAISCGPPDFYESRYVKGTQLAAAVTFLQAHKGKVDLVTINIGGNDTGHVDAEGNLVVCLFPPEDCEAEKAGIAQNLDAILAELSAAAGPDVPIIGMTYPDVFAPLFDLTVTGRVAEINAVLSDTYAAAGDPVADVAGAFENGIFPDSAENVCAWTWFCALGDVHPNAIGSGVIAAEFFEVIP